MPTYAALFTWTDEGVAHVQDAVERARQTRAAFERRGFRRIAFYWAQGQYDGLIVADAPDEQTMSAVLLTLATQGNLRTETLRLFNESEMKQIIQQMKRPSPR
jgi:uncharacterized protein with GYD domain